MRLDDLRRDFRFSVRSLVRARGFSLTVIATLTLCIGANTTILSVLYGLILKPMPFHDAGQLVEVYASFPKNNQPKRPTSVGQYLDYREHADLFEGFALWTTWTFNVGEEGDPIRGIGALVTADYFSLLGVQPLLGRFYTMEECVAGNDDVIVLTQSHWENEFHGDPTVINRVLRLDGKPMTVIGVAPRSMEALNTDAIVLRPYSWSPRMTEPLFRAATDSQTLMYARVKSGVAHTAALAQLATLEQVYYNTIAPPQIREHYDRVGFRMELNGIRTEQTKSVRTGLLLLQGGALFVLLLGCVNVTNLMLVRSNARAGELAVRRVLGAGRAALARQFLVEALLLTATGAVFGLALTWASLRLINTYTTTIVRQVQPIALDGTILTVTLVATLGIAMLIALLPIAKTWRTNLLVSIQGGTRGATAGRGLRAASGILVIAQVALALTLLVGAGLLIRSFGRVLAIDPGFDADRIVQGRVAFYPNVTDRAGAQSIQELILTRMREIPGVEKVAYTSSFPLDGRFPIISLPIRGFAGKSEDTQPSAAMIYASADYFDAMGIELLEGRTFNADDTGMIRTRQVFIVDEEFARRYFPGRSPVGETLSDPNSNVPPERQPMIIGVVSAAKLNGLDDISGTPFVFRPVGVATAFSLVLRTSRPADQIVAAMREKLRSIDPSIPLYHTGSLQDNLGDMLRNRSGVMMLLGAFAGIALVLSAVGIYGMLAYDVTQRTKEIGIRGAIGATRGQIIGMILRQGLAKAGIGLAFGLVAALILTRFMRSLLFDIAPFDPAAFVGVSLLLLLVATVASLLPALRAARVDPVDALRAE